MKFIKTQIQDKIATITVDRQDALNALNSEVIAKLKESFRSCISNKNVGVIILTGAGEKAFIAGADIKQMSQFTAEEASEYASNGQRFSSYIEQFPKPVIAAVNGYALGGGCEYAMACHIR